MGRGRRTGQFDLSNFETKYTKLDTLIHVQIQRVPELLLDSRGSRAGG